jgi:hypothetical protein
MTHVTNPVITAEQAREITGGREPLVPEEYTEACKLLAECREIDEAKYWSDKASALAAWAKIFHSTRVAREARLLKLHAYRRMAELAKDVKKAKGTAPAKVLAAHGLKSWEANEVMAVGRATPEKFKEATEAAVPPAPSYFKRTATGFAGSISKSLEAMYYYATRTDATETAHQVPAKDAKYYARHAATIIEWLEEFESNLTGAD